MYLFRDRRFWIASAILLFIAVQFWTGSRYPSLNDKALTAGNFVMEDPLSFTATLPLSESDTSVERIGKVTYNWILTNKKGMIFGVLFAASLMTVIALFRKTRAAGRLSRSLMGMAFGAPLGVCVNCAAPIARGMAAAGLSVETTLAAMVSSPTLNVVVLTMVFSLFPIHIALAKLAVTILFVVIAIPLTTRLLKIDGPRPQPQTPASPSRAWYAPDWGSDAASAAPPRGWGGAILWVAGTFARNLIFICWKTVPLMLLAGLIGATITTLVPWEDVTGMLTGASPLDTLARMGALAIFGILLPVPIGFDVTLSAALLGAGWPERAVTILLITLGASSVYSFMIVWRAISLKAGAAVMITLSFLGLAAGYGVHAYNKLWYDYQRLAPLSQLAEAPAPTDSPLLFPQAAPAVNAPSPAAAPAWRTVESSDAEILVEQTVFEPPTARDTGFHRLEAAAIGVEGGFRPSLIPTLAEFTFEQSLAAGDFNGDDWPDLLVVRGGRLALYVNDGAGGFAPRPIGAGAFSGDRVVFAQFADLDGDGWRDVLAIVRNKGLFALWNREGRFDAPPEALFTPEGFVSGIAAFGDLDQDGDLDIVVAPRWTGQSALDRVNAPQSSRPSILWRTADGYKPGAPFGLSGAKLAAMISDFDGDGAPDLFFANDYHEPDEIYLGADLSADLGGWRAAGATVFPRTSFFTMALARGDVDNDLKPEYYFANIAQGGHGDRGRIPRQAPAEVCKTGMTAGDQAVCTAFAEALAALEVARKRVDFRPCAQLKDADLRRDCLEVAAARYAWTRRGKGAGCAALSGGRPEVDALCVRMATQPPPDRARIFPGAPEQDMSHNLFYATGADGTLHEEGKARDVAVAGWTWHAAFADLDNDGWQDLFAATGWVTHEMWETNVLFANEKGRLVRRTAERGLEDHWPTLNAAIADFDRDGDLDIATHGLAGVIRLHRNDGAHGGALSVTLVDRRGGTEALGAEVELYAGETRQIRAIGGGGGFNSQNALAAHFGLGDAAAADRMVVRWPDGEETALTGPFTAGHAYRVTRGPGSAEALKR